MRVVIAVVVAVVLGGCTTKYGDFTFVATKNIAQERFAELERGPVVTGKETAHLILGVSTNWSAGIDDAIDDGLRSVPGAVAMTDVTVDFNIFTFLLYGQYSWIVEGTTLIDPALAATTGWTTSP